MTKRRTLAALAAIALALPLAACGGSGGSGGSNSGKLTFFSWDGEDTMKPVIAKFEQENPGIKVEFSNAPPVPEYISTLQSRILSGTAADVFAIAAENKTNLINGKHVVDLRDKPYLKNVPKFNQTTYSGPDGAVYGLSVASWGAGVLYNKDLLAKVGATTIPQTWDEFLALCHKLKDAGVTPYLESVQGMSTPLAAFLGAENQTTGDTMDKKIFDGSAKFKDYWVEPLTQWSRLWTEGLVTRSAVGLTGDQVRQEFVTGKAAMMIAGPWDIPGIRKAAPKLKIEMAPVPGIAGGKPYLAGAASPGYAINSKAKNPEAADKFLAFLATPEAMAIYQKATGAITVTSDFQPTIDPALSPIVKDVRAGNVYLPQIAWKRAEDILNVEATAQLQLLVQGKATPEQVANALDTKLASTS
ncbi:raffinose/stachyose/melibiose transport system substrate-binding protein [Kribbella antiqua]|uniref:Raffinose/stachyose/melibiose transport system substrate-binding protein n=1 Tax=Kribbella antiqua TaxID=2512217 RepID=A0A4R2I878_9ACTN|nr:extracellular solute-binding protein [Kribbella antiqua]TCO40561.1 raffinose/stachyose/melibiose transport system substrate-binding protein [Kribbella antiqua]